MLTVSIDRYLTETAAKRGCDYSYGIRPGRSGFDLVIYRHGDAGTKTKIESFVGPMKHISGDQYAVTFEKANTRVLIDFFM
jgi:hypothetical protein